jgi:hypothetical protein
MLRDSAVKKSRRAAEFVNRYAFAVLCPAAGCFAGVWGALAGLAAGTFITLVRIRRLDEKGWKRAVEQGKSFGGARRAVSRRAVRMCSGRLQP